MEKRFLAVFLALALCLGLMPAAVFAGDMEPNHNGAAYPVTGGSIYFDKETGTVVGADKGVTAANIPAAIEGVAVTKIGSYAFFWSEGLKSVTIPDGVTEIGIHAFAWLENLTGVTIPASVEKIGEYAFYKCTGLTSVTIAEGVKEIGWHAFSNCTSLLSVTIPNSITEIGDNAFAVCTSLTSITIPVSVKVIGSYAFDVDDAESEEMVSSESLKDIYYGGTKEQWDAIRIDDGNETLKTAAIHFNGAPAFTDVPGWCAAPVAWAVGREITNGTGDNKFSPHDDCKHAEILTFLWRAAEKPASSAALPVDITGKNVDWAAGALRWAAEKGMVDGALDPGAPCTRADAVAYIWKALGGTEAGGGAGFSDVPAGAAYAKAVAWAVANGVTNGYEDGTFGPGKTCSRGEIVTFLHRACVEEARLTAK